MKEDILLQLADERWSLMMRTLEEKGPNFAFDVFADALRAAKSLPN